MDHGGVQKMSASAAPRFARILAFSAFFTTLPIYSPNVMALQSPGVEGLVGLYVEPLIVSTMAISALCAVFYGRKPSFVLRRPYEIAAVVLYTIGCLGFSWLLGSHPSSGQVWGILSAVATSLGLVFACSLWARVFSDYDLASAMRALCVVYVISVACNLVLPMISDQIRYIVYAALVVMGASWPILEALHGDSTVSGTAIVEDVAEPSSAPGRLGEARVRPEISQERRVEHGVRIMPFISVMGTPLLGMIISSFATAVQPVFIAGGPVSVYSIGMLGAAAILAVLWLFRGKQPLYIFLYQVALPMVACIVIVACAIPGGEVPQDVMFAVPTVFYSLVSVLALASACAIANANEFPRMFVFSTIVFAFTFMTWVGLKVGGTVAVTDDLYFGFMKIGTAAYCCWMLMHGCIKYWSVASGTERPDDDLMSDKGAPISSDNIDMTRDVSAESLEQRIERIADEAKLSPREREIMGYVGRGHSSVYVAKNLLISESTVYTHVRNIYRKLGVTSREDLIQILNGDVEWHAPCNDGFVISM